MSITSYPNTTVQLTSEQYAWLAGKAREDAINPSRRVELLVQQAKEADEFVPERVFSQREENGPKFPKHVMPLVQVRTDTWHKVESLARKKGWSTDSVTELALTLLLKRARAKAK